MVNIETAKELDSLAKMYVGTVVKINIGFSDYVKNEICYLENASVTIKKRYCNDDYINSYERKCRFNRILYGELYNLTLEIISSKRKTKEKYSFFFETKKSLEMYLFTSLESPNNYTHSKIIFLKNCYIKKTFIKNDENFLCKKGYIFEIVGIFKNRKEYWRWSNNITRKSTNKDFFDDGNLLNKFEYFSTFYLKDEKENLYKINFKNGENSEEYFKLIEEE